MDGAKAISFLYQGYKRVSLGNIQPVIRTCGERGPAFDRAGVHPEDHTTAWGLRATSAGWRPLKLLALSLSPRCREGHD